MKFTTFQSDKGDCLLLEADDGTRILADGGMVRSYKEHVAGSLARMRENDQKLDLVYVSHIDEDHIAGILQMMDDEAAWRVYDYQQSNGNTGYPEPESPRPPEVAAIWHNAFHEQLGENAGPIEDMLAASSSVLSASASPMLLEMAEEFQELALSVRQAILLSRRVGGKQLNIPLNPPADGKLMYVRPNLSPFQLGNLKVYVIGPFEADLRKLRTDWNAWLRANRETLRKIQREAREDEENMGNDVQRLTELLAARAEELGRRDQVTPPNLASLMLLIEEPSSNGGTKRYLMTGDGAWQDIVKGLEHHGFLTDESPSLHVDVLKIQHHGSENNANDEFFKKITADHYIFCGNGEHENPDVRVVRTLLDSRIGPATRRSSNAETDNQFKVWFNSSSQVSNREPAREHMRKLENIMQQAANTSNKVRYRFLESGSKFSFTV